MLLLFSNKQNWFLQKVHGYMHDATHLIGNRINDNRYTDNDDWEKSIKSKSVHEGEPDWTPQFFYSQFGTKYLDFFFFIDHMPKFDQ